MVALLVFLGFADTLNELGDQMGELLLAARGKLVPNRGRNWGNLALLVGRAQLSAPHAFPPLPA
jgi:hypothetical protein